jgi:hypothetical protein
MTETQGNKPDWLTKADEYRRLWSGKRIAVVDDNDSGDDIILSDLFETLGLEVGSPNGVIIDEFTNPYDFMDEARDYDLCLLDGNFGPEFPAAGPESIEDIRGVNPSIRIIGRSGEPKLNKKFSARGADLVIPKLTSDEGSIPNRFGEILDLAKEEREYPDWSNAELPDLIKTQDEGY